MPFGCVGKRGINRGSKKKDIVPSGKSSSAATEACPALRNATFPASPAVVVFSPVANDVSSVLKEVEVSTPPPVVTTSKAPATENVVIPPATIHPPAEDEVKTPIAPIIMMESVTTLVIKDEDKKPISNASPQSAVVLSELTVTEKNAMPMEPISVEEVQISELMLENKAAEGVVPSVDAALPGVQSLSPDAPTRGNDAVYSIKDCDNAAEIEDNFLLQFPLPRLDFPKVSLAPLNLKTPEVSSTIMPLSDTGLTGLNAPDMLTLPYPFLPVMNVGGERSPTSVGKPNWNIAPPMLTLPAPGLPKLSGIDEENTPDQVTSLAMPNLAIPAPVLNPPTSTVLTPGDIYGQVAPCHVTSLTMSNLDISIAASSEPGVPSEGLSPPLLSTVQIVNDDINKSPLPPLQTPSLVMVSPTLPPLPPISRPAFSYDDDYDYVPNVRTLSPPMLALSPKPVFAFAPRGIPMRMPNLNLPNADMTPRATILCATASFERVQVLPVH